MMLFLGYYIDFKNEDKYLKTIKNYVELQLKLTDYIIKEPNKEYRNYWLLKEEKPKFSKEPVELDIKSITKKGFTSNAAELNQNNIIKVSKDALVELDITVDYVKK